MTDPRDIFTDHGVHICHWPEAPGPDDSQGWRCDCGRLYHYRGVSTAGKYGTGRRVGAWLLIADYVAPPKPDDEPEQET